MIADIADVVIRLISYEASAFGGLCNRHVILATRLADEVRQGEKVLGCRIL